VTDYSTYRDTVPTTLLEALAWSASSHPRAGVALYDRRGRPTGQRTLSELLETADEVAKRLARAGVGDRTPLVLALPTSWEWIETWLGALRLGALPVAISPASPLGSADESLRRLGVLFERLNGQHIVCTRQLLERVEGRSEMPEALVALTPETLAALPAASIGPPPEVDPTATAFLQLTSGTTGESRVVMIPHRAVVLNVLALREAVQAPLGERYAGVVDALTLSWLPLYHDMGLVGSLLGGLIGGLEVRLLPPTAFLGRPATWLRSMDPALPTVSTAPNFGYQFCAEQLAGADLTGIDLSNWLSALVGAEMVRVETLANFTRAFERVGFNPRAYRPCYGMAEAALGVTMDCALEGPRTAPVPDGPGEAVCLGHPVAETEVRIATPDGEGLPEDRIGEIRVRGPGIFSGYLGDAEATHDTLDGEWLKTGDLGFLQGGELYITGRIKDILVIRGQNLMPHELERLAEAEVGGGGTCRAAAFAVDRGADGEQIVVIAEAPTRAPEALAEIADTVRRNVGLALGLPIADLAFVASGRLPRTTSGKVLRRQVRQDYLDSALRRLEY
jgi:acyl-CoA synthetase (AMP-forming)/AMP-acid ligase II